MNYWNKSKPLNDIELEARRDKIPASSNGEAFFSDININEENGTMSASLWVDSRSKSFENITLEFNKNNDPNFDIEINTDLINSSWMTASNNNGPHYQFSAFAFEGSPDPGMHRVATVTTSYSTRSNSAHLSHGRIGESLLLETFINQSEKFELINGQFNAELLDGFYETKFKKDPITGLELRSIDSWDALMALKMSSGIIKGADLEHQAQWLAADVDNNGFVQAKDAWIINQCSVGNIVDEHYTGNWQFIDSTNDLSSLGAMNTGANDQDFQTISVQGESSEHINILALIKGDIDGSYTNYI